MTMEDAKASVGARVIRRWANRPVMRGVITGVWPERGFAYVLFDGTTGPQAVDPALLELEGPQR